MSYFDDLEKARVEKDINKKMFNGTLILLAIGLSLCSAFYVVLNFVI